MSNEAENLGRERITLLWPGNEGVAYFEGESGSYYVRPTIREDKDRKIRLMRACEARLFVVQSIGCSPLGEVGRKFDSFRDAEAYMDAIADVDLMISMAQISVDGGYSEKIRGNAAKHYREIQGRISGKHGKILETIPVFGRCISPCLELDPLETSRALKDRLGRMTGVWDV